VSGISPNHLVAHRGYQKQYPENTLAAVMAAVELGARFVECDVQLTADRVPVLYHDEKLERVSGKPGRIMDVDSGDLGGFVVSEPGRLGSDGSVEPVLTLEELTGHVFSKPVTLYVELKKESLELFGRQVVLDSVINALKGFEQQYCLISFDEEVIRLAQSMGVKRTGVVLGKWGDYQRVYQQLKPEVLFVNQRKLPEGEIDLECELVVYEIDDLETARALLHRGVDRIETFDIGGLLGSS
jgi:glycerophosphoryl diester phosphodiesterase